MFWDILVKNERDMAYEPGSGATSFGATFNGASISMLVGASKRVTAILLPVLDREMKKMFI